MANINEISQGSQYTGDVNLGGGTFGVGKLDTSPIEDLARYTMLFNKAEYDQRQKDAEKAADEISDLIKYDLTSGIPKDAQLLQEKYDKLIQYVKENPSAIDYRNKKEWAEYNKMRNELENDIRGGKVRSTLNTIRENEIAAAKTQPEKDWLKKQLDKNIADTDIRTPIQHTPQYDDSIPKIPDAQQLSFDVLKQGPNQIFDREHKMLDMGRLNAMSIAMALELSETPDESTLEGQVKGMARKRNPWLGSAESFNKALDGYKDKDGNIDESRLKGTARSVYGMVKEFNKYVTEKKNEISAGIYRDKLDKPISFGPGALKEEDYATINVADGISPDELAKISIYDKAQSDSYNTKVIQTNDQIEKGRLAETTRHNKAAEGIGRGQLQLEQDKWKETQIGGETVKNGAMERAKRIYGDMQKLADANGVISPDKIRQLNQEQLKYLGIETVTQSEGGVTKSVFTPLNLKDDEGKDLEVAIQLINGEVRVLGKDPNTGKINKLSTGAYEGLYDNSKSTNLFNIATNILNEELQKAGAKELNAYMPIDLGTGGVSTNTTGASTSGSGGTYRKEITRGELAAKAKAAGYTPQEYEAALKAKGIIIKD